MEENLLTKNGKTNKIPVLPLVLLIFTIALTLGLFGYNMFLQNGNGKISESISSLETSINKFKEDKNIQVYNILKNNKSEIEKYERNSDIVKYMDHLDDISKKYKLSFSGFSISNGEVKSEINVRKIDSRLESQSYEKVSDFIKNYRADENALLDLKFIDSFEGMDNIKFSVNFGVKNIIPKTEENTNLDDNKKENE